MRLHSSKVALALKVPPVAVVLFMGALMWLVSWAWAVPVFGFVLPASLLLAVSLGIAGVVISILGIVSFRRAKTTVNPMKPDTASSLVRSGVYTFSRNPMYLGFLLLLAGWAVFLSNAVAFVFLPAFVFYMNRFQIDPEERALTSLFRQEFADYTSRVRRWL
jgi:protein-S-isoprenylcysteine O-methyltransferase Ste14